MSTLFSSIYSRALFKLKDYDFLQLESGLRNQILHNYLISAQSEFQHCAKQDLSQRNDEEEFYEEDLDEDVIEILCLGVAYYWMSANTLDSDKMRNHLNTKDYSVYSPANLLDKLSTLRKDLRKEFEQAIKKYTYRVGDLAHPNG